MEGPGRILISKHVRPSWRNVVLLDLVSDHTNELSIVRPYMWMAFDSKLEAVRQTWHRDRDVVFVCISVYRICIECIVRGRLGDQGRHELLNIC